ncbi:MAG: phosphodiester glycosidase family protein, partial [Sphaerochaeta sp.]|nr:phosphodiester glycosidase family protein [Sphaerochaeta sp.]
ASRGSDIIITEARVVAVREGGETEIPMAGFVLALDERITVTDPQVRFFGLEEYVFGVQVGPPMVEGAVMYQSLASPFYDRSGNGVPFPPTVYPLPYESARAARIAIGTDHDGKAVVIWAEGASKCRHVAGKGSSGSSLLELAHFCAKQGYTNVVNLDGGGSAQILFNGERALCISDRYDDNEEAERPVPMLLVAF